MLGRQEMLRVLSGLTDRFTTWELAPSSRISQARGKVVDPHRELVLDICKQLGVFRNLGDDPKKVRKDDFLSPNDEWGHESYWYSEKLPNGVQVDVEFHVDPSDNNVADIFVVNGEDGTVFGRLECDDLEDIAPAEIDKIREFVDIAASQEASADAVSAGFRRGSRYGGVPIKSYADALEGAESGGLRAVYERQLKAALLEGGFDEAYARFFGSGRSSSGARELDSIIKSLVAGDYALEDALDHIVFLVYWSPDGGAKGDGISSSGYRRGLGRASVRSNCRLRSSASSRVRGGARGFRR